MLHASCSQQGKCHCAERLGDPAQPATKERETQLHEDAQGKIRIRPGDEAGYKMSSQGPILSTTATKTCPTARNFQVAKGKSKSNFNVSIPAADSLPRACDGPAAAPCS
ncbi:uncharacterized protein BKA78DRAFT_130033 [Phyllosticta capitalensis]|uniref:uncharacterized protein n=1 Tax=Phyllosticta capitalensis TaxID=121624 RepID=UPI00312E091E